MISCRIDWLDPMTIQEWFPVGLTLKSLLQHHSSKASTLWCSVFFMVQTSHPYMTAGKTLALTRWTFVGKVRSLPFKMLSRLVRTFLPRSKHLLISLLKSPPAVILEPKERVCHSFHCFPIFYEVMGPDVMIFIFLNVAFETSFLTLLFHLHQAL